MRVSLSNHNFILCEIAQCRDQLSHPHCDLCGASKSHKIHAYMPPVPARPLLKRAYGEYCICGEWIGIMGWISRYSHKRKYGHRPTAYEYPEHDLWTMHGSTCPTCVLMEPERQRILDTENPS